jgi:hypothetical protein
MLSGKEAERFRENLRLMNMAQALAIIDLDNEKINKVRRKCQDWRTNEAEMQCLSEDAGGIFRLPEEPENLFRSALEIANAVDSYYLVTYLPKTYSTDLSERKVRVSTNLNGVTIQSRTKISMPQSERKNFGANGVDKVSQNSFMAAIESETKSFSQSADKLTSLDSKVINPNYQFIDIEDVRQRRIYPN